MSAEENNVGFGKPPKERQFRKGQSGNPKGRPKRDKTIRSILQKIATETITAKLPTGEKQIPVLEFVLRSLVQRAAKGDNRATTQFIDLMMTAFGIGENDDVKRDLSASELEGLVKHQFQDLLADQSRLARWVQTYTSADSIMPLLEKAKAFDLNSAGCDQREILRSVFPKITLCPSSISFQVDRQALFAQLGVEIKPTPDADIEAEPDTRSTLFTVELPITIKRRGVETRAVIANHVQARLPDATLVDTIARAHFYLAGLTDGTVQSIADLAKQCGVHRATLVESCHLPSCPQRSSRRSSSDSNPWNSQQDD